jgi:hypothetical protein
MEDVFVRKLPVLASAGVVAAALAGTAFAAAPQTHVMNVTLPDGSVAHVEYVGDVAPKVTVVPRRAASAAGTWEPFPPLAGIDRMVQEMRQRSAEMVRRAQQMAQRPAAGPYVAAYGNAPAGGTSTTVVSVSNNGVTCTRTTQVVSQGPGKPPKVTSNASGQCGDQAQPSSGRHNPA